MALGVSLSLSEFCRVVTTSPDVSLDFVIHTFTECPLSLPLLDSVGDTAVTRAAQPLPLGVMPHSEQQG